MTPAQAKVRAAHVRKLRAASAVANLKPVRKARAALGALLAAVDELSNALAASRRRADRRKR